MSAPARVVPEIWSMIERELVLLAGEEVVLRGLDPGAADVDERVAERIAERRCGLRVPADKHAAARSYRLGDQDAVRGRDRAALDLLLLDQRATVVALVLELLGLEHGPARGEHDKEDEEQNDEPVQADDLRVHPGAPSGRRALSDTSRSSASRIMFATIELPRRRRTAGSRRSAESPS